MSAALGGAHVIPDSMGGVETTACLLREGGIVPEGPMAGEKFVLAGLNHDDIAYIATSLYVQYDAKELRLIFTDPERDSGTSLFPDVSGMMFAFIAPFPSR
jgi:hypothetical protein